MNQHFRSNSRPSGLPHPSPLRCSPTCSCVRSPVMVGRCLYWLWLRSSSCSRIKLPMPLVRPRSLLLLINSCCRAVQRPTTRGTLVSLLPLQSSTCRALKAPKASGRDCSRLRARRRTCSHGSSSATNGNGTVRHDTCQAQWTLPARTWLNRQPFCYSQTSQGFQHVACSPALSKGCACCQVPACQ